MSAKAERRAGHLPRPLLWVALAGVLVVVAVLAVLRGGLLGLPRIPSSVTAADAGLAGIDDLTARARLLAGAAAGGATDPAIAAALAGLAAARAGDLGPALDSLRQAMWRAPRDLVIGNAYRMTVLDLRRRVLEADTGRTTLAVTWPLALEREPIATLERLNREHPCREAQLQLALAWVDELLLHPALEIRAPASVESVRLLTDLLARDPWYVPALYGRGLNYLHRPARLVWPESRAAAPDAASSDIGRCIAVGRSQGGGTPRLVGTLALSLGDAFAKEGRYEKARSWWQIARNASGDKDLKEAVRDRFTWDDRDVLDRLESTLVRRMADLDHPLTDLSILWH